MHVHQAYRAAALERGFQGAGLAQRAHVVDEARARGGGRAHHRGLAGVDGDDGRGGSAQPLDHRHDAAQLLLDADRRRARPRRLAADVDERCALLRQAHAMRDGCVRLEEPPAVGERIRRHVHHAHHDRAAEIY
jgi:hypothetical protein